MAGPCRERATMAFANDCILDLIFAFAFDSSRSVWSERSHLIQQVLAIKSQWPSGFTAQGDGSARKLCRRRQLNSISRHLRVCFSVLEVVLDRLFSCTGENPAFGDSRASRHRLPGSFNEDEVFLPSSTGRKFHTYLRRLPT